MLLDKVCFCCFSIVQNITCQQALRGTLATGREKEGELGTTSLEFEYLHWEMLISGDDISNQNITLGSLLADYPECGMNVYLSIVHFPKQSSNREVVVVYLANVYINRVFFSPRSWNQLTTDKGKSGDSTKSSETIFFPVELNKHFFSIGWIDCLFKYYLVLFVITLLTTCRFLWWL